MVSHPAVVDPRPTDYRDSGLCRAVLGPDGYERLGASPGQVVRITTARGRSALCRLTQAADPPGAGAIRIDRFTRQALKAYPHETVQLELVDPPPATEVALVSGVDAGTRYDPQLVPALRRALSEQRVPVRAGMLLYVRASGALAGVSYDVHYVAGGEGGEGVVTPETTLWLVQADHDHGPEDHEHDHQSRAETVVDTTFEDVGGLTDQIREVREFVELPLVFPQVYRQLGINPPRGVIFYGAPGTGKTLLARSVANEINAQLFYINGPEVIGTYSGETEANLRKIFAEAGQQPPSIVFIDELDAIAPARRSAASQSEARSVTQLLALLDGLTRTEGVIVIATTNRVDAIDPALRRAGRFDREIHFPTPAPAAREQILRVQTREMPLDDGALAALPEIAGRAYGFVGADLMELSREAGLAALRRVSHRFVAEPSLANYPAPEQLVVGRADFQAALDRVRPAAMRESLLDYPTVSWADIGGLATVRRRLIDLVATPLRHPDAFVQAGLAANLGVLLYGPPGTGKTLLAKALARETGVNFLPVNGPELFSQWLGESERGVRHVFEVARQAAPCLVFFDQLDAVLPARGDLAQEGTRAPQRVVNQILAELDGMQRRSQVVVLGATNRIEAVDPAALRPGRFGVHLRVDLPDDGDRAEILRIELAGVTLRAGLRLDELIAELVPRTAGLSGADLAFLGQTAKLAAMQAAGFGPGAELDRSHFGAALADIGGPA